MLAGARCTLLAATSWVTSQEEWEVAWQGAKLEGEEGAVLLFYNNLLSQELTGASCGLHGSILRQTLPMTYSSSRFHFYNLLPCLNTGDKADPSASCEQTQALSISLYNLGMGQTFSLRKWGQASWGKIHAISRPLQRPWLWDRICKILKQTGIRKGAIELYTN